MTDLPPGAQMPRADQSETPRRFSLEHPTMLGAVLGRTLVGISDADANPLLEEGADEAHFHFDNGVTVVVDFVHRSFRIEDVDR